MPSRRLPVTAQDGREFVLIRSNRPGYWRLESIDRVGEWCGSVWTDRPRYAREIADVAAAETWPQHRTAILSIPPC